MGYFDKLKKMVSKDKKPRKPKMNESDNPTGAEAATSFAEMLAGGKKKDKEDKKEKSGY